MKNTFYKQRNLTIKMYTNKFPEKRSNSVSNNVGRYHCCRQDDDEGEQD